MQKKKAAERKEKKGVEEERDGVYAKFKRDGGYKLPNRGSGRTNISQADRNKIIRPEGYYRYSERQRA